jgi:hypothetical protein
MGRSMEAEHSILRLGQHRGNLLKKKKKKKKKNLSPFASIERNQKKRGK